MAAQILGAIFGAFIEVRQIRRFVFSRIGSDLGDPLHVVRVHPLHTAIQETCRELRMGEYSAQVKAGLNKGNPWSYGAGDDQLISVLCLNTSAACESVCALTE